MYHATSDHCPKDAQGVWGVKMCMLGRGMCRVAVWTCATITTLGLASVHWGLPQYSGARLRAVGVAARTLWCSAVRPKSCAVCDKKFYMEYFLPLAAQVLGRVLALQMSMLCTPDVLAVHSKALVRHGLNVRHHTATVHIPRPNMNIFMPQAPCASLGRAFQQHKGI